MPWYMNPWVQLGMWILVVLFITICLEIRWRMNFKEFNRRQDADLDRRVNEIITNRRRQELLDSGRDYPARIDSGKPGRISKAKFRN